MFIYYKQKEKDDLAKVEAVNDIIQEATAEGTDLFDTGISPLGWQLVLSGAVSFAELFVNAYMVTHHTEKQLADPNIGTFAYSCPKEVQEWAADITQRLGKVRFRPEVIIPTLGGVAVSAAKIKKNYPRWYTVEVADITRAQIEEGEHTAAEVNNKDGQNTEVFARYRMAHSQIFTSTPRAGYRVTVIDGKLTVTFKEMDYYEDMAKRKLNL